MSRTDIRIGDAEREQAVSALGEHYLAGRLTKEEYDERAAAAWTARTTASMQPLFWDLPALQRPEPTAQPQRRSRRRRGFPVFPFVVLFVFVLAVTPLHIPWWGWLIFGWMWCTGMFAGLSHRFAHRR